MGGSGFGILGGGKEKTKTDMDMWTDWQKKLGRLFGEEYLMPRLGKGMERYEGILPGTSGPSGVQQQVFDVAAGWTPFGGAESMDERVAERLGTRRKLMQPTWEKEDALLKEQAYKMGLASSSDVLKERAQLQHTRAAEEEAFSQGLYDLYEQWNLELTPQAMQTMAQVGEMQRMITEQGHQAEFNEWLRTQPEYSPVIDQILAVLGMQPVQRGTQESDYMYWEGGGQGGFGRS